MSTFASNQDGNVAMTFSVVVLALLTAVGAAGDYSMKLSSQSSSQDLADSVALNAAAFVRLNNEIPEVGSTEGLAPGDHKASDFGYVYQGWVDGGAENVNVNIAYDDVAREATVIVSGNTKSIFSQILGREKIPFQTKSVVNFETVQLNDVASIVLVLDNSGSMAWDDRPYEENSWGGDEKPDNAVSRISALETSVNGFMAYLNTLVGDQSRSNDKILRTGMLAYNSSTIHHRTKQLAWETLSTAHVNAMGANGGTNPTSSMAQADSWLSGETAVHQSANGKTPLRYAIFMSDGVNNNSNPQWRAKSGTNYWRTTYRAKYSYNNRWYQQNGYEYHSGNNPPMNWNSGWQYSYGGRYRINYHADGWVEGEWNKPDDEATLAKCEEMKNDGVKIYTIGFGLEPGKYGENSYYYDRYSRRNVEYTETIDSSTTDAAYSFLSQCATSEENFVTARNSDELNAAFDSIGADIVSEVIRIKS